MRTIKLKRYPYKSCLTGLLFIASSSSFAQVIPPDSAGLALKALKDTRQQLLSAAGKSINDVPKIRRMLELGMWKEAESRIAQNKMPSEDFKLLTAEDLILHNEFVKAEAVVNGVLKKQPANTAALLLKATLEIQAWRLPSAATICTKILQKDKANEQASLLLGRSLLLQKKYPAALNIAKKLQQQNAKSAGAYQLEADVYFWDQHPELAEAPLKKSLAIDPYNADARFSYGYAIWRRIDATQLNAMAAQWEIALALNPLHFSTNWHWGNGHTNLTYADYAAKDDEEVRKALAPADSLFSANKIADAIEFTRVIQKKYPASVLPLMHRGSIYYSAFDNESKARLDSAENIFKQILLRKKHYGPAHNGLSAVIKSKRIPYLAIYDSITNVLKTTKIKDLENFERVFPDVAYYPGEIAKAMAYNQLYAATVYFPFLSKQGNVFRVSPLHIDLAITMNSPSFRYNTTFDNRQWMDIRGVGSGAADIEYVERGAYEERNVILHEYVHLYHGRVLTDDENRQVRKHYYKAMAEHRTLDYYSQNNESEYFAQTYPAYFEPVKVHPLDFKSMNTRADLISKDPEMYDFIDKLVKKQRAYLAGDKSAMASNWSQVYLNISRRIERKDVQKAIAYLDTALTYDSKYLPAYLGQAQIKMRQKDFAAAEDWLKKAEAVNAKYAPIYADYADLVAAKYDDKKIDAKTAVADQAAYLKKSIQLEDDYQELAGLNMALREMYRTNGMVTEAIATAEEYGKKGAGVSTYLRDRKDDAVAFAANLKSALGDETAVKVLGGLVAQKPQNFEYRNLYADALAANKNYPAAIATIQEAQRILSASGNQRSDYSLRIAEFYQELGQKDSLNKYMAPFLAEKPLELKEEYKSRYVRLLLKTGHTDQAAAVFKTLKADGNKFYLSDYFYTSAKLLEAQKMPQESALNYEKAITENPYNRNAYRDLAAYYKGAGMEQKINELKTKASGLNLPSAATLFN
jgi:tetratricopeptide (TPR) repeat protein